MKYYKTKKGTYPKSIKKSSDNEYVGQGWSVRKESGYFILRYVSGSLQGELKEIRICEDDFKLAKTGNMTLDDFCKKYNIF